jgi:uncharacterized protein (DUF1684 family)
VKANTPIAPLGVVQGRMRRANRSGLILAAVAAGAATSLITASCRKTPPPADAAYRKEIEQWRAQRLTSLTREDGWLSLVGLYWLRPGENRFGSDPGSDVVLRGHGVPPLAGTLELRPDGSVLAHPRADAGVTLAGRPVPDRPLRSDHAGKPDVLAVGSVRFYLIDRAGKLAVRVKDIESEARAHFKGLSWFPIDPAYRVDGVLESFPTPHEATVASEQGPAQHMLVPGIVRFTLAGHALALEPFVSSPTDNDFFFVFRDATTGHQTYGAGRFLDAVAPLPGSSRVVLDFNQAYNPPCAFTPYATCPLPPRQNDLPIPIKAGERFEGH